MASLQSNPAEFYRVQERASTLTHLLGFLLSLLGAAYVLTQLTSVDRGTRLSCLVYLTTLNMVYAVSTLSHAVHHPRWRHWMRIWDQAWIYALISGTYTPFVWAFLPEGHRWWLLGLLWLATLVGFVTKLLLQLRIHSTTTYSYILLGWLPSFPLLPHVTLDCLLWMAAGGALYTLGTLFLKMDARHVYFHAAWHLFVVVASFFHFLAILQFVVWK